MNQSFNPFSLHGKHILVTGASSGIGRSIAISCSRMGANLSFCGRNQDRLEEVLALMDKDGIHNYYSLDLTHHDDVKGMVADLPKLDGIVHCAGVGQFKPCKQIEEADIEQVMTVNFNAPVILQAEILKQKKINKGASIVFIASLAYTLPWVGNSLYSASKGAVISYANVLAKELASRMIRVNCISPAMVKTEFLVKTPELVSDVLEEDEKNYPLKRYGNPDDIANLSIYLLSDASSWMTGTNIPITGGVR